MENIHLIVKTGKSKKAATLLIHLISWIMVFAFPLFFTDRSGESIDWTAYFLHAILPFILLILFYLNTGILIPRLLFAKKKWKFLAANLTLVILLCTGIHLWQKSVIIPYMQRTEMAPEKAPRQTELRPAGKRKPGPPRIPFWAFYLRDALTMAFVIGLAATIKMNRKWAQAEESLRIAQEKQLEAELNNFRNQLNPHFLLNTLNNIYALIGPDGEKARDAVHRLAKLFRYLLYENQEITVPLTKEAEFLKNYIELMKMRIPARCDIRAEINIGSDSSTQVAPLLFISLIENAFKHGISSSGPCFIYLKLEEITGCLSGKSGVLKNIVAYTIKNSCYPKDREDKSGSGIGLSQVRSRLDLLYKDRYKWEYGIVPQTEGPPSKENPAVYRTCLELEIP